MKTIIQDIIKNSSYGIGIGNYFDTHFIIQILIENHSDEYFKFMCNYTSANKTGIAASAHSQISKIVKELSEGSDMMLEQLPSKCVSFNIHHKPTPNAIWKRIS